MNWFSALKEIFFPRHLTLNTEVLLDAAREAGHHHSFTTKYIRDENVELVRVLVPAPLRGKTFIETTYPDADRGGYEIPNPPLPEAKIGNKFFHIAFLTVVRDRSGSIIDTNLLAPDAFSKMEAQLLSLETSVPTIFVDRSGNFERYEPGHVPGSRPGGYKTRTAPEHTPS